MIFFLFLIGVVIVVSGETLETFRTHYNLHEPFTLGQRGLTFKQEMIPNITKFEEFTICFRVNMDFFTIIGSYMPLLELLDGGGWEGGVEVKQFQERTISFKVRDPLANTNLFRVTTFNDKIAEMREKGNKDWHWPSLSHPVNILEWNHFCMSYNVESRNINKSL